MGPAARRDFFLRTITEHDFILSDTKPIQRVIVSQVYHRSPCRRREGCSKTTAKEGEAVRPCEGVGEDAG